MLTPPLRRQRQSRPPQPLQLLGWGGCAWHAHSPGGRGDAAAARPPSTAAAGRCSCQLPCSHRRTGGAGGEGLCVRCSVYVCVRCVFGVRWCVTSDMGDVLISAVCYALFAMCCVLCSRHCTLCAMRYTLCATYYMSSAIHHTLSAVDMCTLVLLCPPCVHTVPPHTAAAVAGCPL